MRHIIIGAGPAGVIAAETLRKSDPDAVIQVLSDEPVPPYSRMALPYYLNEKIDEAGTYLRKAENYFEAAGIELVHDRVLGVDPRNRLLSLHDAGDLNFDKLLIATGSHPLIPPLPGINVDGVHPCWTLSDARKIIAGAKNGTEVVLVGAGFIGCIILEALVSRGVKLNVVEMADRMVPRMMNQSAANLLKDWCQNKGIFVQTSAKLEAIEKNNGQFAVQLDNGNVLRAELVIIATGVASNTEFLEGSGIEVDTGVMVDEFLQTSAEDIYAAGDVCKGKDFSTGGYSVQAIQPTAADQGRLAALNMSGKKVRHRGCINMNVLDTVGLVSASFGLWNGTDGGDSVELLDRDRYRYINLQFEDDTLIGAHTLGLTQHIGVIRGLIQTRLKLGVWKTRLMKDPTRIMEAYLGVTQPVGHNTGII